MHRTRRSALLLLFCTAACADGAARATLPPGSPPPAPLGVYEIAVSGIGTDQMRSSILPQGAGGAGPSRSLTPAGGGIVFEQVASGSFTEGDRGNGGQRYITFTYRVRNGTGTPLSNLTLLMVERAGNIAGTPLSSLRRFDGTPADPAVASRVVPTGAVVLRGGPAALEAPAPDVLQVLQEAEAAAIPRPDGVTEVFPYGFVVRSAAEGATSRTLPAAAGPNQYDGVLTLSFRAPLQASAARDVYTLVFQVLAVQDSETRLTESIEEAQDTAAVRRLRERAAALRATTVTVLAGSPAAAPDVPDYPGQRQVCSVRTAGSAAAPATYITAPAAYTRLALLRPAESPSPCEANFRTGTAPRPTLNVPYPVTLAAMDRYGNVIAGAADTVALGQPSGPPATFGAPAALAGGQATIPVTYHAHGSSLLAGTGRRNGGQRWVEVAVASTVVVHGGNNQAAMAGSAVPTPPSVLVRDLAGNPLPGVPVTFAVTDGGGYVTGASATTNASGVATAAGWVLGSPATVNGLSATAAGAAAPAAFRASGCAGGGGTGYQLTLCYTTPLTTAQRLAFEAAAARWQRVVAGDLEDLPFSVGTGACGAGSPSLNLGVDDLLIFAGIEPIDGPGGILGSAGPCYLRELDGLPLLGVMRFDAADMASLESYRLLPGVILHEMGHVLGIGSLWGMFGLRADTSPLYGPPLDTYFTGAIAVGGFDLVGGGTYTGGKKVPVENMGPPGTINVHWRESVLFTELMTGFASSGLMPLSQVTVRSLVDLGYVVDTSAADPFFLTMNVTAPGRPDPVPLVRDVMELPLYTVDGNGRKTRVK